MNKFALGLVMLGLSTGSVVVAGKKFDEAMKEGYSETKPSYIKRLKLLELWFNAYFANLKGIKAGETGGCAKLANHECFLLEDMIEQESSDTKNAITELKEEMTRRNPAGPNKAKMDFDLLKGYNEKLYAKLKDKKYEKWVKGDWLIFADPANIGEYESTAATAE